MSQRADQTSKRAENGVDQDAALERELAGLRKDFDRLREAKVRAEQDLLNHERSLRELEERAVAEYGTADPEALARLLEEKRTRNAEMVAEYREHIQGIDRSLREIEQASK